MEGESESGATARRCERDWHRLTGKASERGRESVNGSQPRPSLPLALAAPASGMEHQCCSLSLFHAFNFHFVTVAGGMDEGHTVQQIHSLTLDPLSTLSNPTQARRERGREGERGPLSLRCFSGEGRREGGPEMWNKRPSDRPTDRLPNLLSSGPSLTLTALSVRFPACLSRPLLYV